MAGVLGLEGTVNALLQSGADVNSLNRKYETALMYAAHRGNVNIVQNLLSRRRKRFYIFKCL